MIKPIVRCSSLDRLLSCPGSLTLEAITNSLVTIFDNEVDGNAMTWRGNWCHHRSAKRLVDEFGAFAPEGLPPPILPEKWQPQPWDFRTVEWYISNLTETIPNDHVIFVEQEFKREFPRFILTGHIDEYDINAEKTLFSINDLKTGVADVDIADENWQLAGYATLLQAKYPTLERGLARIWQRTTTASMSEAEIKDLNAVAALIESKVNEALDNLYLLQTGKQCANCSAIKSCPCLSAEIDFMKLTLTPEQLAEINANPDITVLGELAARARSIQGPIKRLIDDFKEQLEASGQEKLDLANGVTAELVPTFGDREITNLEVALEFAKDKIGQDAAMRTLSMSLSKLEDELVDTGMKRTSKKTESASGWIKDTLGHLITRKPTKTLKFY